MRAPFIPKHPYHLLHPPFLPATALFRLRELEAGKVLVDGVDIKRVGLQDVRGKGMCIIPQVWDSFACSSNPY